MLIYITDGNHLAIINYSYHYNRCISIFYNQEASLTEEASDELTSVAVYAIAVLGCLEAVKELLVVNLLPLLLYLLRVLLFVVELFKLCTFG
jgi:hypothetical protein